MRPCGLPAEVRPWTLEYNDVGLEARFVCERFRATCAPFASLCGVIMVLLVMSAITYPDFSDGFALAFLCYGACLTGRLALDGMQNQLRARDLFWKFLNAVTILGWVGAVPWLHYDPPVPSRPDIVAVIAVMWCLLPVFLRLSAIPYDHHLIWLIATILGVCSLPQWSTLGRPSETLFICGALAVGELVGFTLEWQWRTSWLALHRRDQALLELHVRELPSVEFELRWQ